jgi:hypothetical protein
MFDNDESDARIAGIVADILAAHQGMAAQAVYDAVTGRFDPWLSDADNEHWALSELGVA